MALAGVAWGVYSLNGRASDDALKATATNFLMAAIVGAGLVILQAGFAMDIRSVQISAFGVAIAVLCGAVTSGLGYALWYTVLPNLRGSTAAVAQLTVPVIAMIGGSVILSETLGLRLIVAATLVLGGVLLAVTSRR
jgi:drug/metabolite transporter (DMT)-like permease